MAGGAQTTQGTTPEVDALLAAVAASGEGSANPVARKAHEKVWDCIVRWVYARTMQEIDHEQRLMEKAFLHLQRDPNALIKWENERNLTKMRNRMGKKLLTFLQAETLLLFALMALQGFKFNGFHIEADIFKIFVGGTIIQVAGLVLVIVKSLFPHSDKKGDDKGESAQKAEGDKKPAAEPAAAQRAGTAASAGSEAAQTAAAATNGVPVEALAAVPNAEPES